MRAAIFAGVLLHYALAYGVIGLASPIERLDAPRIEASIAWIPPPVVDPPRRDNQTFVCKCRTPPLAQPRQPSIVPIPSLMSLRTAGTTDVRPSPIDLTAMHRDGIAHAVGTYEVCVSAVGSIDSVATLKSTTYADYDRRIVEAIRGWRFQPYLVDGHADAVCSAVTFRYSTR